MFYLIWAKSWENLSDKAVNSYPAFFTDTFVSEMQTFYFSESQDAMVLQTCHENSVLDSYVCSGTH